MEDEDEVWITRDGQEIKVCDMELSHVRNALNLVWRNRGLPCDAHSLSDEEARYALREVIEERDREAELLYDLVHCT